MSNSVVDETERQKSAADAAEHHACFHCGTPCGNSLFVNRDKSFCCNGCLTVFELLTENGLADFYELSENAGVRVKVSAKDQFAFLDEVSVRERLVNFSNDKVTTTTFHLPAIHCIACVWLLENLFRINPDIGQSRVNFPRKELFLTFENDKIKLSEVVALLTSLGYEPELKFSDLEKPKHTTSRRLWIQLGVAGFAFGNIMLFSIASYFGLDVAPFKKLFGQLSFALALPVVFFSASDYWKSAWLSARRKLLTIEVPIAAGIAAIFAQSTFEVFTRTGDGYFDSLCGLIFFLLCGKWFQQKTYDRLSFDRDYKSFFPLSVTRKTSSGEETISLSQLRAGDRLLVRNSELIPADARLVSGDALIDYSFVTGEAEPVGKTSGEHLYAGGRQIGGAIEVETWKEVSQSYLTSLWNQDAFQKEKTETLDTLINVYSQRFTKLVLAIALGTALFWFFNDAPLAVKAFTSVLIVACPCALALAAPFTLGTAQRVLASRNVFLKNPTILETLAKVDAIVFDKTGTLTAAGATSIDFIGEPLNEKETGWLVAICKQSTHPMSARIARFLGESCDAEVRSFREQVGGGIEALVDGNRIVVGSWAWLQSLGIPAVNCSGTGSVTHVAINGTHRGAFALPNAMRPQVNQMIGALGKNCEMHLLSGDNESSRADFAKIFGVRSELHFNQTPQSKFDFVEQLHRRGKTVMMVGDGLNDAGALKNADVGVAVVENISAFSPASDVILAAPMVSQLDSVLRFSKASVRVVKISFAISAIYNVVGISIAAAGKLSPIVCAILMPLSSITVVAFACGVTAWLGRRVRSSRGDEAEFSQSQIKNRKSEMGQRLLTSAATKLQEAA